MNICRMMESIKDELAKELNNNDSYAKVAKLNEEIFKEIESLLPESKKDLIYRFEESQSELINFEAESMYIKGLKMGFELNDTINSDSNIVNYR